MQELFQTIAEDLAADLPAPRASTISKASSPPADSAQGTHPSRSARPHAPIIDLSQPLVPQTKAPYAQAWNCC